MRNRQVWVEPLFAEAKAWHGLRRFRLRGLEQVNAEALLIAAGQHLKRLLSGWGVGTATVPEWRGGHRPPSPLAPASPVAMTLRLLVGQRHQSSHLGPFFNRLRRC
jgi:hypothetical protein